MAIETSIQQLKQLASSKKSDFPTLEQLCAFLDIQTRNIENNVTLQQYLVRRIKGNQLHCIVNLAQSLLS